MHRCPNQNLCLSFGPFGKINPTLNGIQGAIIGSPSPGTQLSYFLTLTGVLSKMFHFRKASLHNATTLHSLQQTLPCSTWDGEGPAMIVPSATYKKSIFQHLTEHKNSCNSCSPLPPDKTSRSSEILHPVNNS